jgi:hypothetical protein
MLNVLVALGLVGAGYFATGDPPPPAAQNEMLVGLLLLMLAIIPSEATLPPKGWRERMPEKDAGCIRPVRSGGIHDRTTLPSELRVTNADGSGLRQPSRDGADPAWHPQRRRGLERAARPFPPRSPREAA